MKKQFRFHTARKLIFKNFIKIIDTVMFTQIHIFSKLVPTVCSVDAAVQYYILGLQNFY
jgi:hypothetical protein